MKCYRIREHSRVTFFKVAQIQSEEITYDRMSGKLSISLLMMDGRKIGLSLVMAEEEKQQFEQRWERFKTSDEIFFDLGEFAQEKAT